MFFGLRSNSFLAGAKLKLSKEYAIQSKLSGTHVYRLAPPGRSLRGGFNFTRRNFFSPFLGL